MDSWPPISSVKLSTDYLRRPSTIDLRQPNRKRLRFPEALADRSRYPLVCPPIGCLIEKCANQRVALGSSLQHHVLFLILLHHRPSSGSLIISLSASRADIGRSR